MHSRRESEPQPVQVEIRFGTYYSDINQSDIIKCIIQITDDYFISTRVYTAQNGRPMIKANETNIQVPSDIGIILHHYTLDEVIEAYREGAGNGGFF